LPLYIDADKRHKRVYMKMQKEPHVNEIESKSESFEEIPLVKAPYT
jgi:hypothetical protein